MSRLLAQGHSVTVGDLKECPPEWVNKVEYIMGDLNNLGMNYPCDVFFHLAATFERLSESLTHWEENFHHNVKLSHHLLNKVLAKRVVFASSYLLYSPFGIWPRNLTGAAKLYTELELEYLHKTQGLDFSVARIYRVYGKGSKDVISRWIRALLKGEEIELYNPDSTYDYIYAGDVADMLLRLPYGTTDVGTGKATMVWTLMEILRKFFPAMKLKLIRERQPGHEKLDSTIPAWNHTPLEEGIRQVIEYEKCV